MSDLAWRYGPALIERTLEQILPAPALDDAAGLARLRDAMRWGALDGGKRLRPLLLLEAASLVGGETFEPSFALPAACAIELIHAYSLVHDDLPAMDDAATRRGRPTCHRQFGDATAVLAGDALQTMAFETVAGTPLCDSNAAPLVLRVVKLIAQASGEAGMAGGQSIDLSWSGDTESAITAAQLTQMHALKTGALIATATECGAILGGGTDAQIRALRCYGENLGRAFQIWDDVLDVEGDPAITGKCSTDTANDKSTFTAIYGLDRAKELAVEASEAAVNSLDAFGPGAKTLRNVARYVVQRNK